MYSKAQIAGHPIHPMLTAFPIAFYTATVVAYIYYAAFNPNPFWFQVGYIANVAGVLSAIITAIPGLIDYAFGIPKNTAAKKTGSKHLLLNVLALFLFATSAWLSALQLDFTIPDVSWGIALSVLGLSLTMVAGALGWKLIGTHHVGVDETPELKRSEPVQDLPDTVTVDRVYTDVKPLTRDTSPEQKIEDQKFNRTGPM